MNWIYKGIGILILLAVTSCLKDKTSLETSYINLKWNKAYPAEQFTDVITGLEWAFSHIGANNSQNLYAMQRSTNTIRVNVDDLGFSENTRALLRKLNEKLIVSEEYHLNESIDLGRYVSLLIGASEHYYAFVGIPEKIEDLFVQYDLVSDSGYINNSFITNQHRVLRFSDQNGLSQLFVTEERDPESGVLLGVETIDLMQNGQLRFGIFTAGGIRKNAADPMQTEAGKPAKCMWCHESGIQPLFGEQVDVAGYLTYVQLRDTLQHFKLNHEEQQTLLTNAVDYTNSTQHEEMELVYISFMEPSAERLAAEWSMTKTEIEALLAGVPTHEHEEFTFLGDLYFRGDIAEFAPFASLAISSSIREKSAVEVNHLE